MANQYTKPGMKTLRERATKLTTAKGHHLRWYPLTLTRASGTCMRCGRGVYIDTTTEAITGEAVVVACTVKSILR